MTNRNIKNALKSAVVCTTALFASLQVVAAQQPELPPGGTNMLSENAFEQARLHGSRGHTARLERVNVDHPEFSQALRITTTERSRESYDAQLRIPLSGQINADDTLYVEFWVRVITTEDESGDGLGGVVIEEARPHYVKAINNFPVVAGPEWLRFTLPETATYAVEDGHGVFNLRVGMVAQTIEVAGFRVYRYGPEQPLDSLPQAPTIDYEGRELDAPWRAAAAERIDTYRKADLEVAVKDSNGNPIPNAEVNVSLQRHAFLFSSAIGTQALLADESNMRGAEKYREMIPELFNMVTIENNLKWANFERNPERAIEALQWLKEKDIPVRGHVLLWPSWRRTPEDLPSLQHDLEALRKRIFDHFASILGATKDLVGDWDVINEPQTHYDLIELFGPEFLAECFKEARRLHPDGRLFLNEALSFSQTNRLEVMREMALKLRDEQGAPVDGLGFQCHYRWTVTPPEEIITALDRFADDGFVLQVTEFDIATTDLELQADYLRDFYTAVFSHPAVDAIQLWGFWEGRHWRPDAALWNRDWTIRPIGQAYLDLLQEWDTQETVKTDAQGLAKVRGFHGEYAITVTTADGDTTESATLSADGTTLEIVLR